MNPFLLSSQVNPRDNRLLFEVFDENRVVSCVTSLVNDMLSLNNCNCLMILREYQPYRAVEGQLLQQKDKKRRCKYRYTCFLHRINPFASGAFCQKLNFWTFWRFSAWIWARLAPIYSKGICNKTACLFLHYCSIAIYIFAQACREIKLSRVFGRESDLLYMYMCAF